MSQPSVSFSSETGICSARRRFALASELATAALMRARFEASASMKKFTVEPVPTPTVMSSPMNCSAASAAAFFCAFVSMTPRIAAARPARSRASCLAPCYASRTMKKDDYLEKILTARVYDVAIESPLEVAGAISRRMGNHILLKREDKQAVFSFKLRGAYNKMASLAPEELARGVICA